MASSEEAGWGSAGEVLPSLMLLLGFSLAWGAVLQRDGSVFAGLSVAPPVAMGMLSAATTRMVFGRGQGGVAAVGGVGAVLFAVMLAAALVTARLTAAEGAASLSAGVLGLSLLMGVVGSFVGSLALAHYLVAGPTEPDEDVDDLEEDESDDIDYTTQPEELVCLLTNQVVNPEHDEYIVCHNHFNQTQVCHAVYLKAYVHLLEGRCRRCFQALRDRDLEGMQ